MKTCVLASGSEGNCVYIETTKHKILADIGTNVKYIRERLEEIDVDIKDIEYVIITHVHSDHIKALNTFINKYNATIMVTQKMYEEIECLHDYDNIILYDDDIFLDGLKIAVIKTSHDASDSRNFIFTSDGKSVAYITDTGYLNQKYFRVLSNLNVYLFESNHDIEMLMNGPYPKWLKDRVVGATGHLSNKDSSIYLAKLIGPNTKKIILTHLSKHNNTEEIALETINNTFKEYNVEFSNISCARQKEKSELIEL
ncbi:MAG: MBL fold metallo-hydrolase [Bacilli bacterium]